MDAHGGDDAAVAPQLRGSQRPGAALADDPEGRRPQRRTVWVDHQRLLGGVPDRQPGVGAPPRSVHGVRIGLIAAVALWTCASVSHAFAATAVTFALARAALGFGEGATFPGGLRTATQTLHPDQRARGVALAYSGGSLGAVLTPLVVTPIALRWGWRGAFLCTGLFGVTWLVVWAFVSRDARLKAPPRAVEIEAPRLADPSVWGFMAAYAFGGLPLGFVLYGAPLYLGRHLGFDQAALGHVLWIPPLGWEVGYFFWGWIIDRTTDQGSDERRLRPHLRDARGPRLPPGADAPGRRSRRGARADVPGDVRVRRLRDRVPLRNDATPRRRTRRVPRRPRRRLLVGPHGPRDARLRSSSIAGTTARPSPSPPCAPPIGWRLLARRHAPSSPAKRVRHLGQPSCGSHSARMARRTDDIAGPAVRSCSRCSPESRRRTASPSAVSLSKTSRRSDSPRSLNRRPRSSRACRPEPRPCGAGLLISGPSSVSWDALRWVDRGSPGASGAAAARCPPRARPAR